MQSVSPGVVDTPLFTNVVQDDITGGELDGAPALKPEAIANGIMYVLSTPEDVHVIFSIDFSGVLLRFVGFRFAS